MDRHLLPHIPIDVDENLSEFSLLGSWFRGVLLPRIVSLLDF
jgi:hypothetical protein